MNSCSLSAFPTQSLHCSGIRALLPVEAVSVGVCMCLCDHCLPVNAHKRKGLHEASPYDEHNLQLLESFADPGCCAARVVLLSTFPDGV